jgi:hypothetical protein
MSDENGEGFDDPQAAAEYEAYLDSKIETLAENFESWMEQTNERVDELERQIENQNTSQKQRLF